MRRSKQRQSPKPSIPEGCFFMNGAALAPLEILVATPRIASFDPQRLRTKVPLGTQIGQSAKYLHIFDQGQQRAL